MLCGTFRWAEVDVFQTGEPQSLDQISSLLLFFFFFWQILGIADLMSDFGEGNTSDTPPALAGQWQYALPSLIWHVCVSNYAQDTSQREAPGKAWCCHVCPPTLLHHLLQSPLIFSHFLLLFQPFRSFFLLFARQHLQKGCPPPALGRWAWWWKRLSLSSWRAHAGVKIEVPNKVIWIMRQRCEPLCSPPWGCQPRWPHGRLEVRKRRVGARMGSCSPGHDAEERSSLNLGLGCSWSGFQLVQIIVFILAAVEEAEIYSCSLKSPWCPASRVSLGVVGSQSFAAGWTGWGFSILVLQQPCPEKFHSTHLWRRREVQWTLRKLQMEGKNLYLFYLRESLPRGLAFQSGLVGMERVAGSSKPTRF